MKSRQNWFNRMVERILGGTTATSQSTEKSRMHIMVVLGIFWESVRKFPITVLGLAMFTILGSSVSIVVPMYYKDFFNVTAKGLTVPQVGDVLIGIIVAIFALNVLQLVAERAARFVLIRLTKCVVIDLRIRAFDHLIGHSHAFFAGSFSGALVQRLTRIVRSYDRIADSIVFHVLPALVTVIGVVVVLWNESRVLTYAIIAWVIVLLFVSYVFARWKLRYDIIRAALDSKVTAVTADILSNQPAIETHGSHELEKSRHAAIVRENFTVAAFTWRLGVVFGATQHSALIVLEFFTFFVGVGLWLKGEFPLSMFILAQAYVFRLSGQLWPFSQVIRDLYESFAEAQEPAEFMVLPHEIREKSNATALSGVKGDIEFRDVSFCYQGKKTINHVSLVVCAGERLALVGPSGAGKSTLTKLLLRLYDTSSGSVLIDGVDVRDITLGSLKHAVSIVPQDPILFHRSLRENIRYGKPDATDDEVIRAATLAHCDCFIRDLPQGYDTLVGERGVKLSGGERQRVAIARAFLKNAPILVLDEATSSLDSLSEQHVQEALNSLMHKRTTLIIAHRLSTIRNMHRIIVLDEGRVTEDGTHQELLARNGLYASLWNLQQSGFTLEDSIG